MGLEELMARLERDTAARVAEIDAGARVELAAIERARSEASASRQGDALAKRRAERRAASERELSAARRRAVARVLEARTAAIERVLARAGELLDGAHADPSYRASALVRARAALAYAPEAAVVRCRPDLAPAFAGLAVREDASVPAGFVVEAGELLVDETLRSRLARLRDALRIDSREGARPWRLTRSPPARARGLATHLATRAELEALAGADVEALAAALGRGGRFEPIAAPVSAASIEQSARRTAARHLGLLARWDAAPALEVFWADQERRALRALLRGAAASEPAEDRLAGLVPTPLLPERALAALAHEPTAARVAAHLVVLAYPGAGELAELASRAHPVLFELELALLRELAARLARASSSADANLRRVIAWKMDVTNAVTALTIAAGPRDVDAPACFLSGGRALGRDGFLDACAADSRLECGDRLSRALGESPLAGIVREVAGDGGRLERRASSALLAAQGCAARIEPLSSAPLVEFLLLVEAQSLDVRRLAWGAALGAPASVVVSELVTPWS